MSSPRSDPSPSGFGAFQLGDSIPPAPASQSPPPIPDHQLLHSIGRGSYGEVWLARSATGSLRAVKIVRRSSFDQDRPYEREFEGIKNFEPISHARESQVDIFHVGRNDTDGFFYYIMELADPVAGDQSSVIRGPTEKPESNDGRGTLRKADAPITDYFPRTLKHDLRSRGALPVAECVQIALSLTRALEHLHSHGLVHRDIKPSNIIFVNGVPKLADIGLVTSVDATRSFVGTDGYIPPEGPGSPQADFYSLGKVLYECVTGKDRLDFPELPTDWRTHWDFKQLLEFNEVLTRACDTDPRQRYPSAEQLRADLELLQSGNSVKKKRDRQKNWKVGKRVGVAAVILMLLTIVALRFPRGSSDGYDQSSEPEVNALVEQGFVAWREGIPQRTQYAEQQFQKAHQIEPTFVPALYGLGAVYLGDGTKLREIAKKLEEIAPDSAETWQLVAYIEWNEGQFRQGLADMKRATEKRPACKEGHAWAHGGYGYFLQNVGDAQGALEQYRQAKTIINGIDPIILDHFGHTYYMRSNLVEALNYYQASIDQTPTHIGGHWWKARTLEEMGRFDEATEEYEKSDRLAGEDPVKTKRFYDTLRSALQRGGTESYWRKKLEEAHKETSPNLYYIATLYARLGEWDRAYDHLERAFEQNPFAGGLMVDLCWKHTDERFQKFARKIGLMQ
ncbi:MAG TPA: serine/threonine-protein kinase [Verrucomicrobiota bacterium]|nr:hypothetical protein [Verrucomicrobiales bacterium]HRI14988.1 serine/threonine-protein kinase [Verrucomicrobiota bacterium]